MYIDENTATHRRFCPMTFNDAATWCMGKKCMWWIPHGEDSGNCAMARLAVDVQGFSNAYRTYASPADYNKEA